MLDITTKGTCQTADSMIWDYYQDDQNPSVFYVVPTPTFARDAADRPVFSLVEYSTSDATAGSGYCYLSTILWIPPDDLPQIVDCISQRHPGITPQLNTLEFKSGGEVTLQYSGDDGLPQEVYAKPSDFGANLATFIVPLSPQGMALFKTIFSGQQTTATVAIVYEVSVPARLPAVTVTVKFDSAIAYEYQRRHTIEH